MYVYVYIYIYIIYHDDDDDDDDDYYYYYYYYCYDLDDPVLGWRASTCTARGAALLRSAREDEANEHRTQLQHVQTMAVTIFNGDLW